MAAPKFFTLRGRGSSVIGDRSDADTEPDISGFNGGVTITPAAKGYPIIKAPLNAPDPMLYNLAPIEALLVAGQLRMTTTQADVRLLAKCSVLDIGATPLIYVVKPHHITVNGIAQNLPTFSFVAPTIPDDHDDTEDGPIVVDWTQVEWLETAAPVAGGFVVRNVPSSVERIGDNLVFKVGDVAMPGPVDISDLATANAIHFVEANEAAIRAAVTEVAAAGGGTVHIAAGTVTLTSPLPLVAGVVYQGVPPELDPTNHSSPAYLGDMEPNFVGGTILVGNGTFAAFEANATALGSPANPIGDTQISNAGIRGFAIDNFTYGVHVGARNTIGAVWGSFEDLYITRCSQWGVKLVNFQHCRVSNVKTWLCQNGQFYGNDLPASVLMCGNSSFDELFNMMARDGRDVRLCRGIVFDAGTGDGILNELLVGRIQVNQFKQSQLSVAATFTNGSANIGVPDGTKFAVNMPVVFTGSGNGFNSNTTYLVASVVGNVITLKPDVTAAAVVASGATGLTLTSWGFPNLEITRQSGTASVRHSKWQHVDIEGAATAGCYVDGAGQVDISFAEHPSQRDHDLVLRQTAFCRVVSMDALKSDFDGQGASAQVWGQRERIIGNEGTGIWLDSSNGSRCMSLTGYSGGAEVTTGDGGVWVGRFGEASHPAGFSGNLDPGWLGHATWATNADRTMTIIDPTAGRLGDWHQLNNVGANTVTVNTESGGSPTFNKIAALQSISVPTKSWAKFVCVAGDDGNPFWLVTKGALATS